MVADTNGYISRGNMTVVMSAAGLVMIAFGGFITFQNNATDRRIDAVREDIKEIQIKLDSKYLRKDEHEEFKYRVDREVAQVREEQQRRAGSIVPRTEHEARWAADTATLKLLSDRLNELRNTASSNSTVPLRDEMVRVQTEITDLRKLLLDRSK